MGITFGLDGPGLPHYRLLGLCVPPANVFPSLCHKDDIIPRPKLSRTAEISNKVSCDETGYSSIGASGLVRVGYSYPSLIYWKTVGRYSRDIGRGFLEESR